MTKKVEINQTANKSTYKFEFQNKVYQFEVIPEFHGESGVYYMLLLIEDRTHSTIFATSQTNTFTSKKMDLLRSMKKKYSDTKEIPYIVDACLRNVKKHFEEQIRILDDLKREKREKYEELGFEYEG